MEKKYMNKEEYAKLLLDPRWQKVRKKIINRDGGCVKCGCKENLRVHHLCYREGFMPWEYDSMEMVTLCESCHQKLHKVREGKATKHVPILKCDSLSENKFEQGVISFDKMQCLFSAGNHDLLIVFMKLCDIIEHSTNRTKLGRKEIGVVMKSVGWKEKKIKDAIVALKSMGFLKNNDGFWYVNPSVFWKGDEMGKKKNYVKFLEL